MSTTELLHGEPAAVAAITLAAGLGTRMRSARAKVLHELAGQPMIISSLRPLVAFGADPVIVVVGHQAEQVEAVVRDAFGWRHQPEICPASGAAGNRTRRAVRNGMCCRGF